MCTSYCVPPCAESLAAGPHSTAWLGIGLVNLLHLYSPEKIVLGGGLSQGLDLMRAGIEAEIAAHAMVPFRTVPIVSAGLGGDSGIIGAASLFQFSNRI